MREILFRGQCCTDGKWVEGYLGIEVPDELVIQQFSYDEYFKSNCIDQYSVKPETVGQYTGLKDKNCTRIFESDVVACNQNGSYGISTIIYDDGAFYVMPLNGNILECTLWDYWYNDWDIEVIGNIFDNSLLSCVRGVHERRKQ